MTGPVPETLGAIIGAARRVEHARWIRVRIPAGALEVSPVIHYEYFGPNGERRSQVLDESQAAKQIGGRALIGFTVVQRYVGTRPDAEDVSLLYFQSEVTGKVWAVYYS